MKSLTLIFPRSQGKTTSMFSAALLFCITCQSMDRWPALSQIESGDNDAAIGRAGEVSRYQILPALWSGGSPRDSKCALAQAKSIMRHRCERFADRFNRTPTDFEFYVLWNAPAQIARPSKAVTERAQRFANLVAKRSEKEREYG
jgi:hypothetical protein